MLLINEYRGSVALAANTLGAGAFLPVPVLTRNNDERADIVEVAVSWSGLTGGSLTTQHTVCRVRQWGELPVYAGSPLAPPADTWLLARMLQSMVGDLSAVDQNGSVFKAPAAGLVAFPGSGRVVIPFAANANGAPLPIAPYVMVQLLNLAGNAWATGNFVVERVSAFKANPARRR